MTEAEANALIQAATQHIVEAATQHIVEAATQHIVESTIRIWEQQIRFLASEVSPFASGEEALLAVADAMRAQTDRGVMQ